LISFDEDTFHKLTQLGRDRMATIQELADEAFEGVLRKHGVPIDLKDALRKSDALSKPTRKKPVKKNTPSRRASASISSPSRSRKNVS
jgi:hypothetical protein